MAQSHLFVAVDLRMDMLWMALNVSSYLVWPQRDGQSYTLLDTSTTDTLPLNREFLSPIGYGTFL